MREIWGRGSRGVCIFYLITVRLRKFYVSLQNKEVPIGVPMLYTLFIIYKLKNRKRIRNEDICNRNELFRAQ